MSRDISLALGVGLPAAVVCLFVAFLTMGAGHGWTTPLWFSLVGFVAFPLSVWAAVTRVGRSAVPFYGLLLALALVGDYRLYAMTDAEGWQYFHRVAPFNLIWLALWSLWQLAILYAFLRALRNRPA